MIDFNTFMVFEDAEIQTMIMTFQKNKSDDNYLVDYRKIIGNKNLFNPQFIDNPYIYHNLDSKGEIEWDEDFNIVKVKY